MLDDQLARLEIKQGCGIHLGTLIPPSELPYPMVSLPNVVTPQFLDPCSNEANFSEVGFFLVWNSLIGQRV